MRFVQAAATLLMAHIFQERSWDSHRLPALPYLHLEEVKTSIVKWKVVEENEGEQCDDSALCRPIYPEGRHPLSSTLQSKDHAHLAHPWIPSASPSLVYVSSGSLPTILFYYIIVEWLKNDKWMSEHSWQRRLGRGKWCYLQNYFILSKKLIEPKLNPSKKNIVFPNLAHIVNWEGVIE